MGTAYSFRLGDSLVRASLASLRALSQRLRPRASHLEVGDEGELDAFFYLRSKGYNVVARRWTVAEVKGDLDLVAWKDRQLCFIEVKTRSSRSVTPAEAAVDKDKRKFLRRLARRYLRKLPEEPLSTRFDIISVYLVDGRKPDIEHFENAFGWREHFDYQWYDRCW